MNECTRSGNIRLTGLNSTTFVAGRIDLFYEDQWRAVCHRMWDIVDAGVVCRQLGFPQESKSLIEISNRDFKCHTIGALSCTNSCFGRNDDLDGLQGFQCSGREHNLSQCLFLKNQGCGHFGGVICCKYQCTVKLNDGYYDSVQKLTQ